MALAVNTPTHLQGLGLLPNTSRIGKDSEKENVAYLFHVALEKVKSKLTQQHQEIQTPRNPPRRLNYLVLWTLCSIVQFNCCQNVSVASEAALIFSRFI